MSAATVEEIGRRLAGGGTLTDADANSLLAENDLVALGMLASAVRRQRAGDTVTFVRVLELDVSANMPDAFPPGTGEVRLTGRPASVDAAIAKAAAAVDRAGTVPVTAWSLGDLAALAGDAAGFVTAVHGLREAGVYGLAETWLDEVDPLLVHRALEAGLALSVVGFRRRPSDPVAGLRRVRDIQDATGRLRAVAPLPREAPVDAPSTGYDDVKLVALARVLVDNVTHVQVDWRLHGPKLAQVALLYGANDFDRVEAGDEAPLGPRRAPLEEVRRNIQAASLVPVARNGRFERTGG
ncbi:MAG TPA: hypothetical protein VIL35_08520 [Vicinamibacterales bacterium]